MSSSNQAGLQALVLGRAFKPHTRLTDSRRCHGAVSLHWRSYSMSTHMIRNIVVVLALTSVALATSACPEKGPAEKAGEKIDNAVDKAKDAVK